MVQGGPITQLKKIEKREMGQLFILKNCFQAIFRVAFCIIASLQ